MAKSINGYFCMDVIKICKYNERLAIEFPAKNILIYVHSYLR